MISTELQQAILARIKKVAIFDTLQMEVVAFADGYCEISVPRHPNYDGVYDSFHGGILMTIADSVACFAIFTKTGPEQLMTTTDMNIRFLAPCLSAVRAKAQVIKFGKMLCPVSVDLYDEANKHIAVAQVTYMLLQKMPSR
ncbi:MAG: hypothetical protein ALAOOOJD_00073 [bacterium]|nr:hypothetical protein [bacterium]